MTWIKFIKKKKPPQTISWGSRKCVSHGKRKVTDAQCTCNHAGKSAGELLIYWFEAESKVFERRGLFVYDCHTQTTAMGKCIKKFPFIQLQIYSFQYTDVMFVCKT